MNGVFAVPTLIYRTISLFLRGEAKTWYAVSGSAADIFQHYLANADDSLSDLEHFELSDLTHPCNLIRHNIPVGILFCFAYLYYD